VIRQAISCDICGAEKRQTNHWFVAYEQAGELRVSGWTSRRRLHTGTKHLCGQTCLHKLVDDFIAKSMASHPRAAGEEIETNAASTPADTSLTSLPFLDEPESSARLISPSAQNLPSESRQKPELIALPPDPNSEPRALSSRQTARYASRAWRAEAWQREREREQRAKNDHPDIAGRRRSDAQAGL